MGASCSLGTMGTSTSLLEMAGWPETPLGSLEMLKTSTFCSWLAGGVVYISLLEGAFLPQLYSRAVERALGPSSGWRQPAETPGDS